MSFDAFQAADTIEGLFLKHFASKSSQIDE